MTNGRAGWLSRKELEMVHQRSHSAPAMGVWLAAVLSLLILSLVATAVAQAAGGSYPSQHWAYATCGRTSLTNTWTVMSGLYMNRADGFEARTTSVVGGGTTTSGGWMTPDPARSYGPQRLYYQVIVATWNNTKGNWDWTYGTWLRGWDALGDGTSGLDSEVWDASRGRWIPTGYTGSGSPWDASYANGVLSTGIAVSGGIKMYVYAHYIWNPIYNGNGVQVFPRYETSELLGSLVC